MRDESPPPIDGRTKARTFGQLDRSTRRVFFFFVEENERKLFGWLAGRPTDRAIADSGPSPIRCGNFSPAEWFHA